MSNNEFLPLPDNPGCYEELKDGNCYFVDKTEYLKTVFTDSAKVLLFTRPRRFGKTLLMTMFESFLKINPDKPFDTSLQQKYFQGTRILEDKEFCSKFMGQYPVIDISLKLYFPRLKFNYRPHSTAVVLFNNRLNTMREKFVRKCSKINRLA